MDDDDPDEVVRALKTSFVNVSRVPQIKPDASDTMSVPCANELEDSGHDKPDVRVYAEKESSYRARTVYFHPHP